MDSYIGTSGWQYGHWRERFYPRQIPQREWLRFFSERFNTVEINTSFYNLPSAENFVRWAEQVSGNKDFVFSVKLYRLFTHYKRLKIDPETLETLKIFLKNLSGLGIFRGPLLIQLPPSMKFDLLRLQEFIKVLKDTQKKITPRNNRYAIEFRHVSWFNEEVYKLLKKEKIALVAGDSPRWPMRVMNTAGYVYLRLHGSQKLYASDYSDRELREWWQKVKDLRPSTSYIYFDNDGSAFAVKNAKFLQRLDK